MRTERQAETEKPYQDIFGDISEEPFLTRVRDHLDLDILPKFNWLRRRILAAKSKLLAREEE